MFNVSPLLKIRSKLSSHPNVFIENGNIIIIELYFDHIIAHIMIRIDLNYGYVTIF